MASQGSRLMKMTDVNMIYRNSIALNNMAIHLLEKQSFRQAAKTFQDAALLMKYSKSATPMKENDQLECSKIYHGALERFLHFQNLPLKISNSVIIHAIFTSSINHYSVFERIVTDQCFYNIIHPIRIDDFDIHSRSDNDNDFECAILLYNFSLAFFAMSLDQCPRICHTIKLNHQRMAAKLLRMSHKTFSNIGEGVVCDNDSTCITEYLIAEVTIISTLMKVLSIPWNDRQIQTNERHESMLALSTHLQEIFTEIEFTNPIMFGDKVSTAASAA